MLALSLVNTLAPDSLFYSPGPLLRLERRKNAEFGRRDVL